MISISSEDEDIPAKLNDVRVKLETLVKQENSPTVYVISSDEEDYGSCHSDSTVTADEYDQPRAPIMVKSERPRTVGIRRSYSDDDVYSAGRSYSLINGKATPPAVCNATKGTSDQDIPGAFSDGRVGLFELFQNILKNGPTDDSKVAPVLKNTANGAHDTETSDVMETQLVVGSDSKTEEYDGIATQSTVENPESDFSSEASDGTATQSTDESPESESTDASKEELVLNITGNAATVDTPESGPIDESMEALVLNNTCKEGHVEAPTDESMEALVLNNTGNEAQVAHTEPGPTDESKVALVLNHTSTVGLELEVADANAAQSTVSESKDEGKETMRGSEMAAQPHLSPHITDESKESTHTNIKHGPEIVSNEDTPMETEGEEDKNQHLNGGTPMPTVTANVPLKSYFHLDKSPSDINNNDKAFHSHTAKSLIVEKNSLLPRKGLGHQVELAFNQVADKVRSLIRNIEGTDDNAAYYVCTPANPCLDVCLRSAHKMKGLSISDRVWPKPRSVSEPYNVRRASTQV